MSKPKTIAAYPPEYFSIFEQVDTNDSYYSGPMTHKQVQSIRLDLYGFRGALSHEEHPSARRWSAYKIYIRVRDGDHYIEIKREEALSALLQGIQETKEEFPDIDPADLDLSKEQTDTGDGMKSVLDMLGYTGGDKDAS